jgi:hypothetical protein
MGNDIDLSGDKFKTLYVDSREGTLKDFPLGSSSRDKRKT